VGGLARRVLRRKQDPASDPAAAGRATVMTSTVEVLAISPDVQDAEVSLPAGFKQAR
jgi:hypothetical protein